MIQHFSLKKLISIYFLITLGIGLVAIWPRYNPLFIMALVMGFIWQIIPNEKKFPLTKKAVIIQSLGGVVIGIFFSVFPDLNYLIAYSFVWVPIMILREKKLARRHGLKSSLLKWGIVLLVCTAAILAPTKYEDQIIFKISKTTWSIQELTKHCYPYIMFRRPLKNGKKIITLKQNKISLRDLIKILEKETGAKHRKFGCGNSVLNLLYGENPGPKVFKKIPRASW